MDFEEIEELVLWNLSFNIPIKETLKQINKEEYIDYFNNI